MGRTELVPTSTFITVSTDPSDISMRGNGSSERTTKPTTLAKTIVSEIHPARRENLKRFMRWRFDVRSP
jgi:hypothetical protein